MAQRNTLSSAVTLRLAATWCVARHAYPGAGKATDAVLFTSAAPAVASAAEWPPAATALEGDEEVALADARGPEPLLGTPTPPVRGASGCGHRRTWTLP